MLEHEETTRLIKLAQSGDNEAKGRLIEENSPLIKSVIKRFIRKGIEYDDLYQLGSLGFLKAIINFDFSFNVKFSTYVVPMVIGEIKRFMRDDGSIKVSRAIKGLNLKINKFIEEYSSEKGDKPSIDIIAKKFEIDEEEIIFVMDSNKMPLSIYTPLEEDGKSLFLIDRYVQNNECDDVLDDLILKDALKCLDEKDKKIILLRFFRDKTQSEIAQELGVSQVQISRLENKILEKLKTKIK